MADDDERNDDIIDEDEGRLFININRVRNEIIDQDLAIMRDTQDALQEAVDMEMMFPIDQWIGDEIQQAEEEEILDEEFEKALQERKIREDILDDIIKKSSKEIVGEKKVNVILAERVINNTFTKNNLNIIHNVIFGKNAKNKQEAIDDIREQVGNDKFIEISKLRDLNTKKRKDKNEQDLFEIRLRRRVLDILKN